MWCWVLMEGMLSFNRVIRLCHSTTSHWKLKALVELFTSGDISNYSPIVLVWLEAVSKCREKLRTDIKIGSLLFFGSIWNITRCIAGLHTHIYTQISDSFKAISLLHKCSFLYIFTWLSVRTHTAQCATLLFLPQSYPPELLHRYNFITSFSIAASSKWGSKSILGVHTKVY